MSKSWGKDLSASLVVFFVALPLCLGIAIASGLPPAKGLITGVIGGIVVGAISGSPLQVSGPAAGLAVIVFELVQVHGISALGPILILAGLLQLVAGLLKLGQWFRAVSPSVIHGMLAGIGLLIILQQFHVMLDHKPSSSFHRNVHCSRQRYLPTGWWPGTACPATWIGNDCDHVSVAEISSGSA